MKWRLWAALAAAVIGVLGLVAWFGPYWPGTPWTVLSRPQLTQKAQQVTNHFGLDTSGWNSYEVSTVSKSLTEYGHGTSPLTVRITFVSKQGGQAAEVGLNSDGTPIYWRAPKNFKPPEKFDSERSAAEAAFQFMAGAQAASYQGPPSRSMGDDPHEEEYLWKKPLQDKLRERIKVVTKGSVVRTIERKVELTSDEDSDDGSGYWEVLGAAFGLLCTVGVVAALCIYILWSVRKAISHQFSIRIALAALVLMITASLAGGDWDKAHSVNLDQGLPIFGAFVSAALMGCFVAVGRGISATARSKWMSLEQLCFLVPVAKSTGESIAAGVLLSPLLVALPFFIAGSHLLPGSWVLPQQTEVLYSRAPLMDSLHVQTGVYLVGFFGFALPALERLIPFRWLRWLIVLPLGTVFFAYQTRVISPLAALTVAGLLALALFWFAWAYFDVLAVLTLQLASGLVLTLLMNAEKGFGIFTLLAALGGLLLVALWFYRTGQDVAVGDPLASLPRLSGFRAEREKLRAEFSVARRAQQDMLPQTPPVIPGYTIAASCTPSLEVGGDLYDFLKLPDGRIGIGVADVSGKGVSAALYMTLTKGLLASVAKDNSNLAPIVEEVNRHLHSVTRKKVFVTMALGFLDAEKRVMECVRAGHNPMVWRQAGRALTTLVAPGGLGLGITASKVFSTQLEVHEMQLGQGDAVVFYSDGITEAMNSELEQFGEVRLMEAVEKTDSLDATASRDSILSDVSAFLGGVHPQDDMTLVVLRVGALS